MADAAQASAQVHDEVAWKQIFIVPRYDFDQNQLYCQSTIDLDACCYTLRGVSVLQQTKSPK
jgi:hypothetical protein